MSESRFLTSINHFMTVRHYSKRTVKTYITWIRAFINFHQQKHPKDMGVLEVEQFLTYLAVERSVSKSTQSLVLNSLAFLYNKYLQLPLEDISDFKKVKRQAKLPTVLSKQEIALMFLNLEPKYKLMVGLLYGSGLRRIELMRLRVDDIDANLKQIRIWNGKGYKHRVTTLAVELLPAINNQIQRVQHYLDDDLKH